jgi:hypothetical protein
MLGILVIQDAVGPLFAGPARGTDSGTGRREHDHARRTGDLDGGDAHAAPGPMNEHDFPRLAWARWKSARYAVA